MHHISKAKDGLWTSSVNLWSNTLKKFLSSFWEIRRGENGRKKKRCHLNVFRELELWSVRAADNMDAASNCIPPGPVAGAGSVTIADASLIICKTSLHYSTDTRISILVFGVAWITGDRSKRKRKISKRWTATGWMHVCVCARACGFMGGWMCG